MWFIYWLVSIAGMSFIVWEMSKERWLLSLFLLLIISVIAAIRDFIIRPSIKKEKVSNKVIVGSLLIFILLFISLAVGSQMSSQNIEEQTEYIQNNQ